MRPFAVLFCLLVAACSFKATGTRTDDPQKNSPNATSGSPDDSPAPAGTSGSSAAGTASPAPSAPPGAYDALFDAPPSTTATGDSLPGLWSGAINTSDVRVRIGPQSILAAMRCYGETPAVGVEVEAIVTADSMKILASKTAPGDYAFGCGIEFTPKVIPRCTSESQPGCFNLDGTTLDFQGVWLFSTSDNRGPSGEFLKLSD